MLHSKVRGGLVTFGLAAALVVALSSTAEAQGGTGLRGEYYDNPTLTGAPAGGRLDATVNFTDFTSAELEAMALTPAGTADENFSVRWQGMLLATATGVHTFTINNDDGMRLWIDGVVVCDCWRNQNAADTAGTISLTAGQRYSIRAEFYTSTGAEAARIRWTPPAGADVAIPMTQLFPDVAPVRISPFGATSTLSQMVTLTCDHVGATIRYTTDGSDVTGASPLYTGPFAITASATVKAMAFVSNMNSAVATSQSQATFTVNDTAPPTIQLIQTPQGTDRVFVTFDEPVATGATTVGNYTLTLAAGGAGPAVTAATAQDVRTVVLTTGALTNGTNYVLSVIDVQDGGGRPIGTALAPYQRVFTARTMDTTLADYWTFDDAGATMSNKNNAANTGALTGSQGRMPGRYQSAIDFNGVTDYVLTVQNLTAKLGGGDCTLTAWVNTTQKPSTAKTFYQDPCIIGIEMGGADDYFYGFMGGGTRAIKLQRGDGPGTSSLADLPSSWHHVAFTSVLSTGLIQIFVDGVAQGAAVTSQSGAKGQPFTVNRIGWTMNQTAGGMADAGWLGGIDEVRIYTSILTTPQIQEHVNQPPAVTASVVGGNNVPFGGTATFNSSATDDGLPTGGGALTYAWSAVSGGAVTFATPNAQNTTATFPGGAGTYVVRVTVSDSSLTSSQDLTVIVDRVTVSPTGNPTRIITAEPNVNNTFNITFNTAPASTVDVTVTSSDASEALVSGQGQGPAATITFTMNAGFVGQIPITLHGQNDDIDDGNINYTVTITTASADGNYNALTLPQVLCTNNDDDTPGVNVTSAGNLVTNEQGTLQPSFDVALTSQPQGANVTMAIGTSNANEGTASPATLTFTTIRDDPYDPVTGIGGWNVPHTVTLTGVQDTVLDFSQTYFITTGVATGADYTALNINPIDPQATNLDDEQIPTLKKVWGCGLTGVEILLPLGLLSVWRRRRRNP